MNASTTDDDASEDLTLLSDTESTRHDDSVDGEGSEERLVVKDAEAGVADGAQLSRSATLVVICAILISNLSTAVDSGLSASTHFAVAAAFGHANLSIWPVNAFVITSMTFQPLYGRVSDYIGRRIPYLVASSFFTVGLLLSAFAPTWSVLILARAICGLGSAGVATMGSVVLTDVVGIRKRGYYQSINYSVYGAGSAFGAATGGLLVQHLGWSWVYKIQAPIVLIAWPLIFMGVPSNLPVSNKFQTEKGRVSELSQRFANFDWRGSLCLTTTLSSLFLFLTLGGNVFGWLHPLVLVMGTIALLFSIIFVRIERKAENPILPPYILMQFPTGNVMLVGFLSSMINYMVLYNTPVFFQTVRLDSVEKAGLRLVVPSVTFTITSALTGSFIAKTNSTKVTLLVGRVFIFTGTFGLVTMAAVFPSINAPSWLYDIMLVSPIVGVGMLAPSTVLTLLSLVSAADHAVANGGLIMMRSLGVFIGTALSTTVVQNVLRTSLRATAPDEFNDKVFEPAIKDTSSMSSLEEPLLKKLSRAWDNAFIAVFSICTIAALIIVISLWRVQVNKLEQEDDRDSGDKKVPDDGESSPYANSSGGTTVVEDMELEDLVRKSSIESVRREVETGKRSASRIR